MMDILRDSLVEEYVFVLLGRISRLEPTGSIVDSFNVFRKVYSYILEVDCEFGVKSCYLKRLGVISSAVKRYDWAVYSR